MKKILSDVQIQTIKYELNYYSGYCNDKTNKEIKEYLSNLTSDKIIDIIFNLNRSKMNDLLLYFYLHSDKDGNIISFNHSLLLNEFVSRNYEIFKVIDEEFLTQLFANDKPLYFLDVDNTLTDRGYLSDEKKNFICNFKYKNNIILSTGKVSDAIMNVINDCQLNENYYSCLNGSVIHKKNDYFIMNGVGKVSKEIIDKLMNTQISFVFYYYDCIKVIKPLKPKDIDNLDRFNEKFEYWHQEINYDKVIKVLAFIDDDKTIESKDEEDIIREFVKEYDDLHCIRTAPHTFEVLRKDQHKGNSVRRIAELMGKYYRLSIGVGDSMNDFKMLEYIGRPYVVSNVSDELKAYGFPILEGNRNIDIVNILQKYGE